MEPSHNALEFPIAKTLPRASRKLNTQSLTPFRIAMLA
jgi:hypothetical protein